MKKCGFWSSLGQNPRLPVGESMYNFSLRQSKRQPIHVERVDPLTPIDPGPASAVKERAARIAKNEREREIGLVSGDRVPVGQRKILIVQHLANRLLELIEHQAMPGQEVPLLILLRVIRVVRVGLAAVPRGLGEGLNIRRE